MIKAVSREAAQDCSPRRKPWEKAVILSGVTGSRSESVTESKDPYPALWFCDVRVGILTLDSRLAHTSPVLPQPRLLRSPATLSSRPEQIIAKR